MQPIEYIWGVDWWLHVKGSLSNMRSCQWLFCSIVTYQNVCVFISGWCDYTVILWLFDPSHYRSSVGVYRLVTVI